MNKSEQILLEFPINTKVFVISNEPEPKDFNKLIIGNIIGTENFGKGENSFPIVRLEDSNKEVIVMGIILEYTDTMRVLLEKLTWSDRWNLTSLGRSLIDYEDKTRKEFNLLQKSNENITIYYLNNFGIVMKKVFKSTITIEELNNKFGIGEWFTCYDSARLHSIKEGFDIEE